MPVQTLQSYATSLAAHRVLLYVVFSLGAVAAVIANALKGQSNFYSVAVFLSRSNGSVVVLGNFGVLIALLCGRLFQQVFFGPLRALEVERLYDRTWFFITESLLAFTIFRDDFDVPFASMFGLLLFTKCFHWLLSDRIEWMDQRPYPGPPLSFYLRVNILFTLLWVTDWLALLLLSENMLAHGLDGKILFASELFVLLASLFNSFAKYLICIVDLRRASARGGENAPPWDDKSMWVFYVELCTDFLKLVTYLIFFTLVLSVYGLPLNIVRDVYITGRSFIMRCRDLVNYRTATRNMDERYPSATDAELNALSDKTCIICREEMVGPVSPPLPDQSGNESGQDGQPAAAAERGERTLNNARPPDAVPEGPNTVPKRLPCGHIFHFQCLRAWLERQQNCPTCRHSVFEQPRVNANANANANLPPPNLFADGQGQQVPQQGNGGGIFGRIVGAAGAPPIVPGQFAQGPGQAQPPQQAQFGPAPGQNGIPQQGAPYLPRHQLFVAPPERFEGFVLPNGNWVPWPRLNDDRIVQNEVPRNASDAVPSSSENASNIADGRPSGSSAAAPGQSDPARGTPIAPPTDGSSPTSPASNSQDSSSTGAREAARAAALRRFGSSGSGASRPAPKPTAQALNNISTASANENSPETPRTEIQTEANVAPTRTNQGFSVAPDLIPLYDPRVAYPLTPSSQHASSPATAPDLANRGSQQAGRHSSASASTTTSQTQVQPNPQTEPTSQSRRLAMQNLRDLPQQLSVEQLTSLDQLTRESIDERLRVLENVEAAAARCITELLRCRSVLPRSSPASPQTVQPASRPNGEQGASSSQHDPSGTPVNDEVSADAQEIPTPTLAETTA